MSQSMRLKYKFQGGGGTNQITIHGGGMGILWNHTMYFL